MNTEKEKEKQRKESREFAEKLGIKFQPTMYGSPVWRDSSGNRWEPYQGGWRRFTLK